MHAEHAIKLVAVIVYLAAYQLPAAATHGRVYTGNHGNRHRMFRMFCFFGKFPLGGPYVTPRAPFDKIS